MLLQQVKENLIDLIYDGVIVGSYLWMWADSKSTLETAFAWHFFVEHLSTSFCFFTCAPLYSNLNTCTSFQFQTWTFLRMVMLYLFLCLQTFIAIFRVWHIIPVSDHQETAFPRALIHVVSASSFFVPFFTCALCSNLKSCTTFQFQERSFLRHRGEKGALSRELLQKNLWTC